MLSVPFILLASKQLRGDGRHVQQGTGLAFALCAWRSTDTTHAAPGQIGFVRRRVPRIFKLDLATHTRVHGHPAQRAVQIVAVE